MDCPDFIAGRCRSCGLLDHSYEQSLEFKHRALCELFPNGNLRPFVPVISAAGSRIRAKLAVFGSLEQPQIGFLDEQKQIVAVDQCPLHHPLINDFTRQLPRLIREARLTPYDRRTDRGELKFVVVSCSPTSRKLMVQFVLRSREAVDRIRSHWRHHLSPFFPSQGEKVADPGAPGDEGVRRKSTGTENSIISVLSVNLQPIRSPLINGSDEIPISEQTSLPIQFGNMELLFGPQSFLQTNYETASALYAAAGQVLRDRSAENVLDLYCGVGAFALTAAASARSVIGIDVSASAIDCATEAARRNAATRARFLCDSLDQFTANELPSQDFDTVICNPPRRGLDTASIALIRAVRPETLLYSSCNPVTLSRDLSLLSPDFHLLQLQPFDMFPFTSHCEVLAVLQPVA